MYYFLFIIIEIYQIISQKVLPTKILVEPESCVNISLIMSRRIKYVSIRVFSKKGETILAYSPYRRRPFCLLHFYLKYVYDVGYSFITLCELDQVMEGAKVMFVFKKGSKTVNMLSDRIKLGLSKYESNCTKVYYPRNLYSSYKIDISKLGESSYDILEPILANQSVKLMLLSSLENYEKAAFRKGGFFSIEVKYNEIKYDESKKLLHLVIMNRYLSQQVIFLEYTNNSNNKIVMVEFYLGNQYPDRNVTMFDRFLIVSPYETPISYQLFVKTDECSNLHYHIIFLNEIPIILENGLIRICNKNTILLTPESEKYLILFLTLGYFDRNVMFFYTHLVFFDFQFIDSNITTFDDLRPTKFLY